MNRLFYFMLFVMLLPALLQAQSMQVSGRVTDLMHGGAISGVSVSVKGTTNQISTDNEGRYRIQAQANSTLVFSYIGMETQEIRVTSNELDVQMVASVNELDQVVAIGYGAVRKGDLSGSSVTVSEEQLKGSVVTNLDQALEGRASGVTATMISVAHGGAMSSRERGQATINANAEPLYVIDGVIV